MYLFPTPWAPVDTRCMTPALPPQHHSHDHRGRVLCHAVGCSRHVGLVEIFGGCFCVPCGIKLARIRAELDRARGAAAAHHEVMCRQAEVDFRKFNHAGHMHWLARQESVAHKMSGGL